MRKFALVSGASSALAANPIRRVVNLLEDMKKEVTLEGEKEEALYHKFKCYCKTNDGQLNEDAKKAQGVIEVNTAAATEKDGAKKQTSEELVQHKKDRKEAKEALATATAVRAKEKAAYDIAAGDNKSYIDATKSAVAALEKGKGAAFIQSTAAAGLKSIIGSSKLDNMDANDKVALTAFLSQKGDYIPQGGEIIGILKNMLEEFDKSLGGIVGSEEEAVKNFLALKKAKEEEIAAATSSIEAKTELKGKLAVEVVQHKAAAESALKELGDAQAFLVNLKSMCANKANDWEARSAKRSEEVGAIAEAIAVLNDDDALDVFKSSLALNQKKVSLLQTGRRSTPPARVARILKATEFRSPAVALLASTAVSALKKQDFSKIVTLIDEMVAILGKEQAGDAQTRGWCEGETDSANTDKKSTEQHITSLAAEIAELEDSIKAKQDVVAQKHSEVEDLDKSVKEATAQRSEENNDFTEMVALNNSAIQLIEKAKNKLNKFYNPHMYKAPEERELTEEERILQGAGQDIGDTTALKTIAGTEQTTTVFTQAPPPPPATYGEFKSKGNKANSVTALLDRMVNQLKSEVQEAEHDEKVAVRDYETLLKDASNSRAAAVKTIADEETAIAGAEEMLITAKDTHTSKETQLVEIKEQIKMLHGKCDFIMENFDERAAYRTSEIEGLKKAKAVLSGASYEF